MTERRAATRRFAFKGRDHGGPRDRAAPDLQRNAASTPGLGALLVGAESRPQRSAETGRRSAPRETRVPPVYPRTDILAAGDAVALRQNMLVTRAFTSKPTPGIEPG